MNAAAVLADEQVRAVQEQLKNQGFYYGEVDGNSGPETSAAISRYQIRNGLKVTGNLTKETLASLNLPGGSAPKVANSTHAPQPLPHSQPSPAQADRNITESDRDFLRKQSDSANPPAASPAPQVVPPRQPDREVVSPPVEVPQQPSALSSQYTAVFYHTQYENAPVDVQQNVLKSAQWRLLREQFYNGAVDGIPGPSTERAIQLFQESAQLPRTGRLDTNTLRELRLLPNNGRSVVVEPFYPPPYGGPQRVYRGIWVH